MLKICSRNVALITVEKQSDIGGTGLVHDSLLKFGYIQSTHILPRIISHKNTLDSNPV